VPASEEGKGNAGLHRGTDRDESALIEQLTNDVLPPERHPGPRKRAEKHE